MIDRIGEYEVRFELGKGGFGDVYLAFDPRVGRLVAIKVLRAEGDASLISRFKTEATAAGNLRHKNIVTVYEYGEDKGMQYLVMEYLDGQDLHRLIEGKQPLTLLHKMDIMSQVAEGLHCAHQNKVVHRDVKPANIMVLSDGSVKIMDFGIARLMREGATRLTQSGFMVGTVSYMAPEQFSGSEVDALCDIWAYGVIYHQLLTGEHPFPGADLGTMMYAITSRDPQPVRSLCPECPETLERVIIRLLSKDRESRYQTLEDVQFDTMPVLRDLQREHASALLGQVTAKLRTQQLDEAGVLARKILEIDPANPEARRLRELIHEKLKQRSARPRVLNLLKQAESEEARRNYTEAIRIVDSALRLAPQDSSIQVRLDQLLTARSQAEQAARLIEQAQKQLDLRNITGAFRDLTAALETDPGNAEAQRLLGRVREEREARERQRRRSEGLSRAKGLLVMKAFDEASELLTRLAIEDPDSAEVQEMIDRLHRERKEDQARQQLQADITACRELLKRGEFAEAIARLEPLSRQFPQESQILDLIAYARDELRTKERNQHCERIGREAWGFFKVQNFDRAQQILEEGLRTYPGEPKLLNVVQRVASGKAEHEKALRLEREAERCREMRRQGRLEDAAALVDSLLKDHGSDVALASLQEDLRRDLEQRERERRQREKEQEDREREQALRERERALKEGIEHARGLLDQGKPSHATQLLQPLTVSHPGNAELTSLLEKAAAAQKEADLRKALSLVAEREDACDWDAALALVEHAIERHGAALALVNAAGRILTRKSVAESVSHVEQSLVRGDWASAHSLLISAKRDYSGEYNWAAIEEKVQAAQLQAEIGEALVAGELDRARQLLTRARESSGAPTRLGALEAELSQALSRRDALDKARKVLLQGDVGQAELAAKDLLRQNPNDAEAAKLLRTVQEQRERMEYAQQLERGRAEIQLLVRQQQFDAAVRSVKALQKKFAGERSLEEDLQTIKAARERQQQRETYDRNLAEAEELARKREFDAAIKKFQSLLKQFPGDAAVEQRLEAATAAKALHSERLNVNERVAELERDYRKGKAHSVKERALALLAEIEEPRARELLEWAEAMIARPPAPEPHTIPSGPQKSRTLILAAVAAVLVAGVVLWIFSRGRSGKLIVKPTQLSFVSTSGGAVSGPNTVTVDGSDPARKWEVSVSDDWISVTRQASSVVVAVNPRGLGPGTYSGLLVIAAEDDSDRKEVRVKLTVQPAPSPPPPLPPPPRTIRETPPPPAKPVAPRIDSFTVEPSLIERGQSATLRWSVTNATDISIDQNVGPVQANGTRQVFPSNTVTYTLTARAVGGTDIRSVGVTVTVPLPPKELPPLPKEPPPPPVVDCHAATYTGLHYGTLRWQNGILNPDAVLVIGGSDESLSGGKLGGQRLPGCDVTVTPATAGIAVEELPSRPDGFRRVKVRNTSRMPLSLVELQWREK